MQDAVIEADEAVVRTSARSKFANQMNEIAQFFLDHEELDLPFTCPGTYGQVQVIIVSMEPEEQKAEIRRWVKVLSGVTKEYETTQFRLEGSHGSLKFQIIAYRDAVCEKKVIGKRKVTIPAKPASTIEVEDVEWDCKPILAD